MNTKNTLSLVAIVAIGAAVLFMRAPSDPLAIPPAAGPGDVAIMVYKSEFCGCCLGWVQHLQDTGLDVGVVTVTNTMSARERLGVPHKLGSCHTAKAGDYWVEGHVPADLVQQLMAEKPDDILGIAVPGMPVGSPGMPGANPVEYDILAYHRGGSVSVYATRQGTITGE